MTWYPQSYLAKVPMTDMSMRADPKRGYPGRTYRFYKGPVVFPFGHGLSYTTFVHALVQAPTQVSVPLVNLGTSTNSTLLRNVVRVNHAKCDSLSLGVHINVKNTGAIDGTQILLVFSFPPEGKWSTNKQLVGFHKVNVAAGSQQRVKIGIHVCKHLSIVDEHGIRRIPMGEHKLHIGDLKHSITFQADLAELKS